MADLRTSESTSYDALFAGLNRSEVKTFPVTVASGQNLKRGALITYNTSTKKVSAVSSTSDEVFGIMAEDVDASAGDVDSVAFVTGDFNSEAIKVASSAGTVADFVYQARRVACFIR